MSEELSAFLLLLNDALKSLADPIALQETAPACCGEHLNADRAGYFEIDGHDCVIERDWAPAVPHLCGRFAGAAFGKGLLSAYQSGRMVVMNDIAEEPLTPEEREAYTAIQVAAQISTPLIKNGKFVGGLTVHSAFAPGVDPEEMRLLEETAERTWAAVERAKVEADLQDQPATTNAVLDAATSTATLDLATVLRRLVAVIVQRLGRSRVVVHLFESEREMRTMAATDLRVLRAGQIQRLDDYSPELREATTARKPVIVDFTREGMSGLAMGSGNGCKSRSSCASRSSRRIVSSASRPSMSRWPTWRSAIRDVEALPRRVGRAGGQ